MKAANIACRILAAPRKLFVWCATIFLIYCSSPVSAESLPISTTYPYVHTQTTTNFSAPAEYCVLASESSFDSSKWTFRYNLKIPADLHFRTGDVFVSFSHPSMPGVVWFSSGETPSAAGFESASWFNYAEHGAVSIYSGVLNPVISVNVMTKPTDISSLEGGLVTISYGLRENANSTIADAYQEMKRNGNRDVVYRVVTSSRVLGDYKLFCFIVTGVKEMIGCAPGECVYRTN